MMYPYDDFELTKLEENNQLNEANIFNKIKNFFSKIGKGVKKLKKGYTKREIKQGSVALFRYKSKQFEENLLPLYDESPLSIILGRDKHNNILGLNTHYLPLKDRKRVIKKLKSLYPKQFKENKTLLPNLNYKMIKNELRKFDLDWLIKSYIPSRISRPISLLTMNQVEKIVGEISLDTFAGISAKKLWSYYRKGYSMQEALNKARKK